MCSNRGFTLVELVLAILLIAVLAIFALPRFANLSDDATRSAVRAQAGALIDQNTLNESVCRVGSADCIDINSTGEQACEEGMASFLPELDLDRWEVENIDSDTPRSEWSDGLDDDQAVFWVTRFLGDSTPPSQTWLNNWNVVQPCILSRV